MNIPNFLTCTRLILTVPFLVLMAIGTGWSCDVALVVLLIAGLTDALDGYFARKLSQATDLGRVADPLVDKVLACGALIIAVGMDVGVYGWMVAVIVAREFVVNGIRTYIESHGRAYGSFHVGKLKMFVEFAAVCAVLVVAGHFPDSPRGETIVTVLVALTLLAAVLSAVAHVFRALPVLAEIKAANRQSNG